MPCGIVRAPDAKNPIYLHRLQQIIAGQEPDEASSESSKSESDMEVETLSESDD